MITKYLWSAFKTLVFGHHVLDVSKSQIKAIKSVSFQNDFEGFDNSVNETRFKNDPDFESFFDFTQLKYFGNYNKNIFLL